MRSFALLILMPLLAAQASASAPAQNLFEWLAVSPVVVVAENIDSYGKYNELTVEEVLRGDLEAASIIRVRLRQANRDRDRYLDPKAVKLEKEGDYLLLLEPVESKKPDVPPTFGLVRGVRGVRELPAEGRGPLLLAARRFVEVQDRRDELALWRDFADMIEDTNPILIETALEQFIKFQRGGLDLLGSLRPLLEHPSEGLRERTVRLMQQILARRSEAPVPDAPSIRDELAARARRDGAVPVRVAATKALGALEWDSVVEVLEEIAREDPDQNVRYAAEKLMFDRRASDGGG